jgi:hypothetical protein
MDQPQDQEVHPRQAAGQGDRAPLGAIQAQDPGRPKLGQGRHPPRDGAAVAQGRKVGQQPLQPPVVAAHLGPARAGTSHFGQVDARSCEQRQQRQGHALTPGAVRVGQHGLPVVGQQANLIGSRRG